jgi:anti-anti-sigma regulatory factor
MSADNQVTLRPQGRFDFNSFRSFRADYEAALEQAGVKCVLVDLQSVQYIDSVFCYCSAIKLHLWASRLSWLI